MVCDETGVTLKSPYPGDGVALLYVQPGIKGLTRTFPKQAPLSANRPSHKFMARLQYIPYHGGGLMIRSWSYG